MQNRHFGLYVAMQLCFVCAYFLHTSEFSIDMIDDRSVFCNCRVEIKSIEFRFNRLTTSFVA